MNSRDKGARAERAIVLLAKAHGLEAQRVAPLQAGLTGFPDIALPQHPNLHIEVKRDERMSVDAMVRQAEHDALDGRVPFLAYRRNGQPWRAVLPLDVVFDLLSPSNRDVT